MFSPFAGGIRARHTISALAAAVPGNSAHGVITLQAGVLTLYTRCRIEECDQCTRMGVKNRPLYLSVRASLLGTLSSRAVPTERLLVSDLATLRSALLSPWGAPAGRLLVQVYRDDVGRLHSQAGRCYRTQVAPSPVFVPLSEIAAVGTVLCSSCLGEWSLLSRLGMYGNPVVRAILSAQTTATRLKSAGKLRASTSASAVQRRLTDLVSLRAELEKASAGLGAHNLAPKYQDLSALLDELVERLDGTVERLKVHARSDAARAQLEERVHRQLLPAKYRGTTLRLADQEVLVGVSPTPRVGGVAGDVISALVDLYAVRRDTVTVLRAPGWVFAFLLQQLCPKPSVSRHLVVSAALPDNPALVETAAALWDPDGEAALVCLTAALDAARMILPE